MALVITEIVTYHGCIQHDEVADLCLGPAATGTLPKVIFLLRY